MSRTNTLSHSSHVPSKVPGLWLPNGDVVLRAGTSEFRLVHKDLVSKCPVFRDILPSNADPQTGGSRLIILEDDLAQELEYFFTALYQSDFFLPPPAKSDFTLVFAILRMAHKYGNPGLRYRALQHVATAFPTTLASFDTMEETRTIKPAYPADLFLAVNVIIEINETWLLPYALYQVIHCCSLDKIHTGRRTHGRDSVVVKISEENQLACLRAYVPNLHALDDMLSFLAPLPRQTTCTSPEKCNIVRFAYLNEIRNLQSSNPAWARHPLAAWTPLSAGFYKDVCSNCKQSCEADYERAREKFWDQIPIMFELSQGWDDLQRSKDRSLHGEEFIHAQLSRHQGVGAY